MIIFISKCAGICTPTDHTMCPFAGRLGVEHPLVRRGTKAPVMTEIVLGAASLDELRAMLPPGLRRLPRELGDEEQIVETWI
jgi:hypothetical protein